MNNRFDKLQVIVSVVLVLCLTVSFLILPDRSFSDKENRMLTEFPAFSFERFITAEWTGEFGSYISDQFPLRDTFVALKAYSELLQGKTENNGVIKVGDTLIKRSQTGEIRLEANLDAIKAFEEDCGIKTVLAALPRSADVFAELLPSTYPKEADAALWQEYHSLVAEKNINSPRLYSPLVEEGEYYRTDHHWTTEGAYRAYCLLGEQLGYTPKSEDFFNKEIANDRFCGTSMRSSGFYLTPKDAITLYRYEGDEQYKVMADGKEISLYDFEKAKTTDAYAVFLGGNHARVDITASKGREKLLLIRDSFADSIAPFLAIHYDLTLIDLRYMKESVRSLAREGDYAAVLILESVSEIAESKNLSYLYKE